MKRLYWKWMDFNERREGNSPWIAGIYCPERTLFPMAPEQTQKPHIPRGIVGTGLTMAAWAYIVPFMEGLKSFHSWEAGSIIPAFSQTLKYTLRQNDLASWRTTPRAGKVNPDQYKWTPGLVPCFCNLTPGEARPLVAIAPALANDIVTRSSLSESAAKPVCPGNGAHIAACSIHSSQGHAEEQTQFGLTLWCPDKLTAVTTGP